MSPPLLASVASIGHVHLVIGSNPLASARCAKSIEVGAKPTVIAPPEAEVHYLLMKRIEAGEVDWIKRRFEEADLVSLGRDEVDKVVDAVFITSSGKSATSKSPPAFAENQRLSAGPQVQIFHKFAGRNGYQSMWSMRQISVPLHSSPLILMALFRLESPLLEKDVS